MRAAFHSAVSRLSSVMTLKSSRKREGADERSRGGLEMQRSGQARHHTIQRGRFDNKGKCSQGQPQKAVTGSPSSRFERVFIGSLRVRLLRLLSMHGRNQSKNRKCSE